MFIKLNFFFNIPILLEEQECFDISVMWEDKEEHVKKFSTCRKQQLSLLENQCLFNLQFVLIHMRMAGVNGQTDTSGVNKLVNMLQGRMKGLMGFVGKRLQWPIGLAHKALL